MTASADGWLSSKLSISYHPSRSISAGMSGASAGGIGYARRILRENPFQPLVFPCGNKPLPSPADVQRHEKMKIGVGEARECQRRETGLFDLNPQFLVQFPDQRRFRPFAVLDLAARKLPKAFQRFSLRALRDQHPAIRIDERNGDDKQKFHVCGLPSVAQELIFQSLSREIAAHHLSNGGKCGERIKPVKDASIARAGIAGASHP